MQIREKKLITHYCFFCGDWVLITDAGRLSRLPTRRTDVCTVIEEAYNTLKFNVNGSRRKTIIKRRNGDGKPTTTIDNHTSTAVLKKPHNMNHHSRAIAATDLSVSETLTTLHQLGRATDTCLYEQQYRLQCKGCGSIVGYRGDPLGETSFATYIYPDTLIESQSSAMKYNM